MANPRLKTKVPRSYSDADESASSFTELGMTIRVGIYADSRYDDAKR